MSPRVRLVVLAVLALGFAGVAVAWLGAGRRHLTPDPAVAWKGAVRPPGARVPDFALRDQDGRRVTPPDGRAIYTFVYSTCDDDCPLQVQQIRGALDRLGRDVPVIGVSVDPANDTRTRARAFLAKQVMTGRMRFALGSRAQLAPVWKAFGVAPRLEGKENSTSVVLTDGRVQRIGFPPSFLTPEALETDLRRLGA